jgi:hypothetical protein
MSGEKNTGQAADDTIQAHDIIAGTAVEIVEGSLPDDHEREFESQNRETVVDRFIMVFGSPLTLFEELTPQKGWLAPLIVVLLSALAHGMVTMNMTDLDGWYENQLEATYHKLPDWQKRQLDKREDSAKRTSKRIKFFTMKAALFVLPWFKAVIQLGFFSCFLYLASALCRGRRSFILCSTVAAHALLVDAWSHLTMAIVAAGTGLVQVSTDASRFVELDADAVLYTILRWLDPFTLMFFFLLTLGLVKTLKVKRRLLAIILVIVILVSGFGLTVGGAYASTKAKSFFEKGKM